MHPSGAVMLDMRTGEKVASFPAVVGSDQIAYNPGDDRFYVTAFGSPGGPVLAAIDAAPGAPVLFARTGDLAHSVAVDSRTNHIFVPLRPDPRDRSCHYGCVGVFAIENSR
jgi:DNA-binding beta-propeller fold protein YncE